MSSRPFISSVFRGLFLGAAPTLTLFTATSASADTSTQKLPNVMIVLDTSGSMQSAIDGSGVPASDQRNRWATVVEALTGTVHGFSTDSTGHVRSNSCSAVQNTVDPWFATAFTNPWDWPVDSAKSLDQRDPVVFATMNSATGSICATGPSGWDQASDGIIDVFSRQIRFGLMTTDVGRLSGVDATTETEQDWIPKTTNVVGNDWSYWYTSSGTNWLSAAGFHSGSYGKSTTGLQAWDVGARNPYARPWQGRLMGFGNSTATADDVTAQNDRIQKVILAQHPVTLGTAQTPVPGDLAPMSAMLSDAYDFLVHDGTTLSNYPVSGSSFLMSPAADPASVGGCRKTNLIIISDGRFGDDMRNPTFDGYRFSWYQQPSGGGISSTLTSCSAGGVCPYQTPDYYANQLANNPTNPMNVQVLGVAKHTGVQWLSTAGNCPAKGIANGSTCTMNCEALDSSDFGAPGSVGKMCSGTPGNWDHNSEPNTEKAGVIAACCELANLAIQVNPAKPPLYFSDNVAALKQSLATIVAGIAGDTFSETEPAFAGAAPTLNIASNPTEAGPGSSQIAPSSFELLSSLAVAHGNGPSSATSGAAPMWRGILERRRLTCSSAVNPTPVAATIDATRGDDFARNLVNGYATRKFFTVVAQDSVNAVAEYRTLRRNDYSSTLAPIAPNNDGLQGIETTLAKNQTPLTTSPEFAGRILSLLQGGAKTEAVLGIDSSSLSKCTSELGATTTTACASLALRWFCGYRNNISGHPNDRCPNDTCSWVPVEYNNQNPLGALYHSTPVTVPPPLGYSDDEAYRSDFAVTASQLHPAGQATRPTMLYAATIDGQLHAFVVAKNSTGTDLLYANVPNPDGHANSGNNELWTFLPPATLSGIWANFDSHSILLDGPLAVSDVLVRRSAADAQSGLGQWKTVLVGSGGASSAGGFYYALDVTNPLSPQFLWQLRTAGNTPVPLFGASVPGAALATVGIRSASGKVDQVGVAILSGGTAGTSPPNDATRNIRRRRCTSCNSSHVRQSIRDWGDSVAARSVTIVELATGRVLKRFEGHVGNASSQGDLATQDQTLIQSLASVRSDVHPFDSPMTGTPIAFPNTPGIAANRAYVGDADGTLWRIDLHDTDPSNWSVDIASDAYGYLGGTNPELAGQPIAQTPVLSVDDKGNPAVMFSTGDQDAFQTYSAGMKNYLVSFVDKASATGAFTPALSFALDTLNDGERVTGPLALFDSNLYFATFAPANPNASACAMGVPKVWGLNFLTGAAGLDTDSTPGPDAKNVALTTGAVVFGVQVNQVPSCFASTVSGSDGWMAGNYKIAKSRSVGTFELVLQTGQSDAFSSAFGADALLSSGQQGASTKSLHITIPTPKNAVRLVSWATVAE